MKVTDLIEALESANKKFKKEFGKPMEIFDLVFNEDNYDGDMKIEACGKVIYEDDTFGFGGRIEKRPCCDIRIHFECEDGKIVDRSITFERIRE